MKKVISFVTAVIIIFAVSMFLSYKHFSEKNHVSEHALTITNEKKNSESTNLAENTKEQVIKDQPLYPKEVFLTIDDGPSQSNTPKVLKALMDNNVKATFFMIGKNAEELPYIVKEVDEAGMSIGNHSYSHDYKCYRQVENCLNDFNKSDEVIEKIINKKLKNYIRFPGGSDNEVSNRETMSQIRESIVEKGMYYVDWNVSFGDADAKVLSAAQIISNVENQCYNRSFVVILMHDAPDKKASAQALPFIIEYLKEKGFVFRTFDDLTPTEKDQMLKVKVLNRGLH